MTPAENKQTVEECAKWLRQGAEFCSNTNEQQRFIRYSAALRDLVAQADRAAELEAAPRADNIPRDTDEKPSDAMPAAGFADWRESSEWWQSTCEYWKARADALAGAGGGVDG